VNVKTIQPQNLRLILVYKGLFAGFFAENSNKILLEKAKAINF